MKFSPQQETALKEVNHWFKHDRMQKPFYYLAGFAGTGKTSLAKYFAEEIGGNVLYCAYTGKAALVMRKNDCANATTIHSLLYIPKVNKTTGEVSYKYNVNSPILSAKLVIVDECSMVDLNLGQDLLSYGTPILVLGDPAQLPPVAGAGFFTNGTPDTMLTEIHRQATDNPIIYLASKVRNKDTLQIGRYGSSIVTDKFKKDDVFKADQIICGLNASRTTLNNIYRKEVGFFDTLPMVGETLICLKNSQKLGIFNGEMFKVNSMQDKQNSFSASVTSQDENKTVKIKTLKYMFDPSFKEPTDWKNKNGYQEMAYGYCLTAHKSQGSQWDRTYIINESDAFGDFWWRWLYTAITRSVDQTTVYV